MERLLAGVCSCLLALTVVGQQPSTRLEGIAVDALSQPVPNALVTVEVEGEVVATSRSDASGTFVFVRLPACELIVRAVTDAPQVGAIRFDLAATLRGVVVVRTMPARRVHGIVRDGSGKPVAGAWVGCTPLGAPEFAVAASQATTDADGRFELSHVPYAETAMRVWHVGHAGFATEIAAPGDVQADVVLTDEDRSERCFVLIDAAPNEVAQGRLRLVASTSTSELKTSLVPLLLPAALRRLSPEDDGIWHMRDWPRCDWLLATMSVEGRTVDPATLRIDGGTPDRTKRFYLVENDADMQVRGRLVGIGGTSSAAVQLVVIADGVTRRVETDAEGAFTFTSPAARGSSFELRCVEESLTLSPAAGQRGIERHVHDEFYGVGRPIGVVVRHHPGRDVELELRSARSVAAVLRDRSGAPMVGAEVRLLSTHRADVVGGAIGGKSMRFRMATVFACVRSGIGGRVEFTRLNFDEDTDLVLQAVGGGGFVELPFALSGVRTELGDVALQPAAALTGAVVDAAGKPVPGARVQIENFVGSRRTLVLAGDIAGRFAIADLLPGPCRVGVLGLASSQQLLWLEATEAEEVKLLR